MAGETSIPLVGNLCSEVELTLTPAGVAVAHFTVASTPRYFDRNLGQWRDGEALFLRCNVWREPAENAAATLSKGSRVLLFGRLKQRSFQSRDGEKRTVIEVEVDELGPSLRWATAVLTRTTVNRTNTSGDSGFGHQQVAPNASTPAPDSPVVSDDPWSAPATGSMADEVGGGEGWATPAFAGVGAGVFGGEPDF
ncbi:single-stranded DNA-binding protein [Nocardia sp. NPDC058497]|uniref:single-stranded DNA-binding protein n=1 Tax=Nocardia sp. NPDC058497 TaxID=3346529 RepID=UPI00365DB035